MTNDSGQTDLTKIAALEEEIARLRSHVSECEKIEAALKESEERYRLLAESARDSIFIISPTLNVLYVNVFGAQQLRRRPEDVIGKPLTEVFDPLTIAHQKEALTHVLRTGKPFFGENEVDFPDGHRWLNTQLVPLRTAAGEIYAVMGLSRDVTEHRIAEEALRISEANYRTIFNVANDAIFVIDIATLALIDANKKGCEMFCYSIDEIRHHTLYDLSSNEPLYTHETLTKVIRAADTGEPQLVEWLAQDKAGRLFWVEINIRRAVIGGKTRLLALVRDINERKRAESEMRTQYEEWSKTFDAMADGVSIHTPDCVITNVNDALCKMLHKSKKEIVGQKCYNIFHNTASPLAACPLAISKESRRKETIEIFEPMLNAWVAVTTAPLLDDRGEVVSIIHVVHDISERKLAEEIIKKERDFISAILDTAGALIVVLNRDGTIIRFNNECERVTGYAFEEVKGRLVWDFLLLPEERETVKQVFESLRFGMKMNAHENYWVAKDGHRRLISWASSVLCDNEGMAEHIIAIGIDITEKRRAEEQVYTLSRAIEQSPSIVMVTDKEGVIEYVNPKFTQLTGLTSREAIGATPRILKSGQQSAGAYHQLWSAITAGNEWHGELLNKKKNGTLYWEFASISPVRNKEGVITHYIKVAEDITERKRLEAIKDDFLSTVSHELRTPMTIIREGVSQILDGVHGPVTDAQRQFLTISLGGIDRLGRIVNDLLDVSKIEAGKADLRREMFNIVDVAREVAANFAPRTSQKNIRIKEAFAHRTVEIYADRDKITQVFTNLLDNACKFTDRGYIKISIVVHKKAIVCSILDTGKGISRKNLARVFSKFEQVDKTSTAQGKGVGLGLSICKGIIELHGGEISVESRLRRWTKFTFTLPRYEV